MSALKGIFPFIFFNFPIPKDQRKRKEAPRNIRIKVMLKGVAPDGARAWNVPPVLKQRALRRTKNGPLRKVVCIIE